MSQDNTFSACARALADLGYQPIPLAGKRPVVGAWQQANGLDLETWIEHYPNCNVGITTGGLAALDCDIEDPEVSRHMFQFVIKLLDLPKRKVYVRSGQGSHWSLMLRAAEGPTPKRSSTKYRDAKGRTHRIEWLGDGQQMLVYGTHPDTGEIITWRYGSPIGSATGPDQLPAVTIAQREAIEAEFERVARELNWTVASKAHAESQSETAPAPVTGLTEAHARDALALLEDEHFDHYDAWLEVGMALHHQFAGSLQAFAVWDEWSAQSPKYDGGEALWKKWQSFDDQRPGGVSIRSVLLDAERLGWTRPAGIEAAPADPDDFPDLDVEEGTDTPSQAPESATAASDTNPDPTSAESEKAREAKTSATSESPLPTIDITGIEHAEIGEPEHIIEPWLPRGVVTLLGAHGGTGKTTLALVQAVCVASGRDFMDRPVKQVPVVFFSAEDATDTMKWRLKKILQRLEIPSSDVVETLTIVDATQVNAALYGELSAKGIRHGATTRGYRLLRDLILDRQAGLVIVDNASDVFEANENERARVRGFMRSLGRIAVEAHAAVELIAHVDKASAKKIETNEGYSGSTAWHNSARSRLFLRTEGVERLVLEHQKANLARRAADLHMTWDESVPVVTAPEIEADDFPAGGAEGWGECRRRVLGLIDEFYHRGEWIPCSHNAPGNAWQALSAELDFPNLERSTFHALIRDLERHGDLEREDYRNTSRKVRTRWKLTDQGKQVLTDQREG